MPRFPHVVTKNSRLAIVVGVCAAVIVGLIAGLVAGSQSAVPPVTDAQVGEYLHVMEDKLEEVGEPSEGDNEYVWGWHSCIRRKISDLQDRVFAATVTPDKGMSSKRNIRFLVNQIPTQCTVQESTRHPGAAVRHWLRW